MFYKEIWEHTEPKSLFLEYLEAQIFKFLRLPSTTVTSLENFWYFNF